MRMGGAEDQAHKLACELTGRDNVRVTYLARGVPSEGSCGYEVHGIQGSSALRHRTLLADSGHLFGKLRELRPDVVYQRAKIAYTAVCAYYARRAGIPLVFHVASDPDADGRLLRRPITVNAPLDILEVLVANWGVRRSSHVVVQTSKQADLLRRKFRREPFALVRNFQAIPAKLPEKGRCGLRVLWVGNVKEVKRPELFLELAECFAARDDIEFWMVGRAATHRGMRATMARIQKSKHVRYFGELSLDAVDALMNEADVFVNTSSFEGFPNTFIQAWARGAIVTSLEVDVDGGLDAAGIGYCTHSLTRLVEVIDQLRRSPQVRREISMRAFSHVLNEHSLKNVERLADLVLGAARSRGACAQVAT